MNYRKLIIFVFVFVLAVSFVLAAHGKATQWELIPDTRESTGKRQNPPIQGGEPCEL